MGKQKAKKGWAVLRGRPPFLFLIGVELVQELSFWTKLAEEPLWLKVRWPYTFDLFDHYLITPAEADVQEYRALMQEQGLDPEQPFQADDADLARVRSYIEEENPDGFSDAYIESLALYQNIAELLLARDVMQFHCSALEMDGRAYLFTAPSGTGKSTHVRLWRQVFGARVTVINDDKPLVRLQKDGSWRVYGTPYGGKHNLQTNTSQTLCGIVMLERGAENKIERVTPQDAYVTLMAQTYHSIQTPERILHAMDLVGSLANLPVFRLQCNISQQAVQVAYEALKGETR